MSRGVSGATPPEGGQEQSLHHSPRGAHPADTPALDFRPPGCGKVHFCDLKLAFSVRP